MINMYVLPQETGREKKPLKHERKAREAGWKFDEFS